MLLVSSRLLVASETQALTIKMLGTPRGEKVWFEPGGVVVKPGTKITFINQDPGNAHTVTTYHPGIFERVRRIPKGATPFHSGYLLPENEFSITLTRPGIYDYYCVPHEMAAMAGRIVVGSPEMAGWDDTALRAGGVREAVEKAFAGINDQFGII